MYNIFISKDSLICLLLIFLQQIIVAFSTIFLAELAKSIASGQIILTYFYLFIGSLVIVYIPATLSKVYLEKSRYNAQFKYNKLFIESHRGKIHLSSKEEEQKLPFITSEGQSVIYFSSLFFYDICSLILNIFASLAAISYIVNPILIWSYAIGFCLLSGFILYTNCSIKLASQKAQESRAKLSASLLKSWKNITINNCYNFEIWFNQFDEAQWCQFKKNPTHKRLIVNSIQKML